MSEVKENKWYVAELKFYNFPDCDWVLGSAETHIKSQAMAMCKRKAENVAKILSAQVDDEGFSADYKVLPQ